MKYYNSVLAYFFGEDYCQIEKSSMLNRFSDNVYHFDVYKHSNDVLLNEQDI